MSHTAETILATPPRTPIPALLTKDFMRRFNNQHDIDWNVFFTEVEKWLLARLSFWPDNTDLIFMSKRAVDEGYEVRVELERMIDSPAFRKEVIDFLYFVLSVVICNGFFGSSDLLLVSGKANGRGSHSDSLDYLTEMAGNLVTSKNIKADLLWWLAVWESFVQHHPFNQNPRATLQEVLDKNDRNYRAIYCNGFHPYTGERLNPDEEKQQAAHARICLRMIREATGNNPEGLRDEDHWSFRHQIWRFWDPEHAQRELKDLLQLTGQLGQTIEEYRGKVLEGAPVSYQEIAGVRGLYSMPSRTRALVH